MSSATPPGTHKTQIRWDAWPALWRCGIWGFTGISELSVPQFPPRLIANMRSHWETQFFSLSSATKYNNSVLNQEYHKRGKSCQKRISSLKKLFKNGNDQEQMMLSPDAKIGRPSSKTQVRHHPTPYLAIYEPTVSNNDVMVNIVIALCWAALSNRVCRRKTKEMRVGEIVRVSELNLKSSKDERRESEWQTLGTSLTKVFSYSRQYLQQCSRYPMVFLI